MEPWKSHALASFGRQHVVLQWGHGDGAVEELAKGARAKDKALLQWGHGDGAVEEPLTSGRARGSEPSFNGATAMEPWKSVGGRAVCITNPAGFNGATAMEPWKRIARRSEQRLRIRFNGATAMEPWKRETQFYSVKGRPCFNGATAMEPWKRRWNPSVLLPPRSLQWGHGDGAVEEKRGQERPGTSIPLQWGHGDGAVEESPRSRPSWCALPASMGPRRWSRGRVGT